MKLLLQDLKWGELNLLALAVVLAVMCLSAVTLLTQGVNRGLAQSAGALLGGDRVLKSPTPIDPQISIKAQSLDLKQAPMITFFSMVSFGDELALSEIKAVGHQYPLKGSLRVSSTPFGEDSATQQLPAPNHVWLDSSLMSLLNAKIGDVVQIGDANFTIEKVITFEPDRSGEGIFIAPRALINIEEVEKTQVLQTGSRQFYWILFTGESTQISSIESWVKPKLTSTQRWITPEDSRPAIKNFFEQANQYLYLIVGANIALAAMAILQATRRFTQRQKRQVALLRCFGTRFNVLLWRYILEILVMGFIAGLIGFVLGLIAVRLYRGPFETLFLQKIEWTWFVPASFAFLLVLALLILFVILPINDLRYIPPMAILKNRGMEATNSVKNNSVAGMLIHYLRHFLMSTMGRLGSGYRYGISSLFHGFKHNLIQLLAFALVMMCGWLIFLVRTELIQSWQKTLPVDAPNYFAINIPPNELENFKQALTMANVTSQPLYAIVRGRLSAINQLKVEEGDTQTQNEASRNKQIRRMLNLSYSALLPKENRIVSGEWFDKNDKGKAVVSLEKGFAERMELKLGDEITFQIDEKTIQARVKSLRVVNWDSLYPNFFVLFPPQTLDDFSKAYMTSFYVAKSKRSILRDLTHQFPAVSFIDVNSILQQLERSIGVVAIAIEFLWGFTGLMALVLLWCTIAASLDSKRQNAILLRALGANDSKLRIMLSTEFLLLGTFAGFIAILGAILLYSWIIQRFFGIEMHFKTSTAILVVIAPILGACIVTLAGWLGIRSILKVPPIQILSSS